MGQDRPLIGITTRQEPDKVDFYLARDYSEAVYAAGGLPFLIPLIGSPEYLDLALQKLHGIIFSGSATDVDPKRYGQPPAPELGPVNPLRDQVDLHLAGEALRLGMPLFGICYGFQMLNVRLGGSLIQDLPSQLPGDIRHERKSGGPPLRHKVRLIPDSLFARLAGGTEVEVNSSHHQAIDRLASDLKSMATSPDGIIEAAVHCSGKPLLAVQWHPEKNYQQDAFSRRLFEHFVQWCLEFAVAKGAESAKS